MAWLTFEHECQFEEDISALSCCYFGFVSVLFAKPGQSHHSKLSLSRQAQQSMRSVGLRLGYAKPCYSLIESCLFSWNKNLVCEKVEVFYG